MFGGKETQRHDEGLPARGNPVQQNGSNADPHSIGGIPVGMVLSSGGDRREVRKMLLMP